MTANAANATFFFDTFTIPYVNTQYMNVASSITAPLANIATMNVGYLTVNSAVVYGTSTLNVYGTSNLSTVFAKELNVTGTLATLANLYVPGAASIEYLSVSNLAVTGNLIVTATNVQTTNAFTINNSGTTTALMVYQNETSLHTHNVAEFWDATTLAMVIDPRGNVAIHTVSSPDYALTVTDPANFETLYIRGKSGVTNTLSVTGNVSATGYYGDGGTLSNLISFVGATGPAPSGSAGNMVYLTSTGVAASTANLFISTSNNVGIGTTNPLYALDIVGQPRYSIQPVLQATQLGIASSAAAGWYRIASLGPTARAKFRIYTSGANLQEQVVVTTAWSAAFSGYPTVRIEDQSSATFAGTAPLFNGQIRTLVYVSSNGTWYLEVYLGSVATAYTLYVQLIEGDASGASITLTSPIVAGSIPTNYTAQPVVPVNSFSVSTWGGGNSALLIDYTGKVGIGTASPSGKLDVRGAVQITNTSGYAVPNNFMQAGSLTIGDTLLNYGGGFQWTTNTAGLLMECLDNTEFAVHDAASRTASFMYYTSDNRFTVGRDMGYGPIASTNFLGRVGIGAASPGSALSFGTPIANKIITLYDGNPADSVSTATNFLGFGINSATLRYQVAATGDFHRFYCGATLAATIAETTATFNGRVVTPNVYYIMGYLAGGTTGGNYISLGVQQSSGGMAVTTSNKLVAPISGLYHFGFNTIMNATTGRNDVSIRVNGSNIVETLNEDNGSGYHYRSGMITSYLNANDFVQFYCGSGTIYGPNAVDAWHTYFFYHVG
jgi:hypothetical protein